MTVIFIQAYFQHASKIGHHDCYPRCKSFCNLGPGSCQNSIKRLGLAILLAKNLVGLGNWKPRYFFLPNDADDVHKITILLLQI